MISIRSMSGFGMVFSELAVAMNRQSERSYGSSTKWSRKYRFCSGSSTSRSADDGSPCASRVSLSTSSSRMSGFLTPTCVSAVMMRPGMAPT